MKILYIPLSTAIPEEDDFYLSLKKAGHEVYWFWFNTVKGLPKELDLIHFQSGAINRLTLNLLRRENSAIITQWTGDYRPEPMEMITQYGGLVNITFMAADVPELYPNENIKWLPHWVGDRNFRPINPDAKGIVMIANNYPQFPGGKEREEMHNLLRQRKDYVCYGSGYEGSKGNIPYRDTPDIYNKFRFAVGCNIYNDVPKYFSNRPLNAMAAGCIFWNRAVPCIEDVFAPRDREIIYYDQLNVKELESMLDMRHSPNKLYFARFGQKIVRENFHSDVITKKFIEEIEKL